MRRIVDWVTTFPQLLIVIVLLVVFDPPLRVARLFGLRAMERTLWLLERVITESFKISGLRIDLEQATELVPGHGYLLIANHQSMFDIPLLGGLLPHHGLKFVAKQSLSRGIPSVSYYLRRGANALIDRDDHRQALGAIRRAGQEVQARGVALVIYPEGTRSRTGGLGEFKRPGTLMLLRAAPELPVVPATIDGSWEIFRHNLLPVPFGIKVRVRLGEPIERRQGESLQELFQQAEADIAATMRRWKDGETDS